MAGNTTSNRASGAVALGPGMYGVANHLLDTPWPKVVRGKMSLGDWLTHDDPPLDAGFALLNDRRGGDDDALPATGVSTKSAVICCQTGAHAPLCKS